MSQDLPTREDFHRYGVDPDSTDLLADLHHLLAPVIGMLRLEGKDDPAKRLRMALDLVGRQNTPRSTKTLGFYGGLLEGDTVEITDTDGTWTGTVAAVVAVDQPQFRAYHLDVRDADGVIRRVPMQELGRDDITVRLVLDQSSPQV